DGRPRAATVAGPDPVRRGNAGAGAGATVGKSRGLARAMKGGIGSASLRSADGLAVAALIAVNAVGDIVDPADGRVVAGVRDEEGNLADARRLLLESLSSPAARPDAGSGGPFAGANTTIGVVAVNAPLTKAETNKVAEMAHDGLARTIYPVHTPSDGDTLFALSTGRGPEVPVGRVGALAAEVVARAVLDAVRSAESLPGLPAAGDLPAPPDR
ncbi:MAG: peptidase S58 family protein, partial [Acidobacteria bacterium]|nr:peptidase S58 family protein [Acidobacteriota bacterium]